MAGYSSKGLGGSAGRKSGASDNPGGTASRPRGGKVSIKSSGTSSMSVSTGTSGKALRVTGKQK